MKRVTYRVWRGHLVETWMFATGDVAFAFVVGRVVEGLPWWGSGVVILCYAVTTVATYRLWAHDKTFIEGLEFIRQYLAEHDHPEAGDVGAE